MKNTKTNQKDKEGNTPLLYVVGPNAEYQDEESAITSIKLLLEAGGDINTQNNDKTPMDLAKEINNAKLIELLL